MFSIPFKRFIFGVSVCYLHALMCTPCMQAPTGDWEHRAIPWIWGCEPPDVGVLRTTQWNLLQPMNYLLNSCFIFLMVTGEKSYLWPTLCYYWISLVCIARRTSFLMKERQVEIVVWSKRHDCFLPSFCFSVFRWVCSVSLPVSSSSVLLCPASFLAPEW